MRPARIEIEIDELVLRGFGHLDPDAVAATMKVELGRLIARDRGLHEVPSGDVHTPLMNAGELRLPAGRPERRLGSGLALATFRATMDAAGWRSAR